MARRLRLFLTAVLVAVAGLVVASPAAADVAPPGYDESLDLGLIIGINQARAAAGSPPLSATESVDIYASFSVINEWACNGTSNPFGLESVGSFGIKPAGYVERVSAVPAAQPDTDAIVQNLLQDQALLDPTLRYVGLSSLSGGQCADTLRTVAVAASDVAWFGRLVSMVSLANGKFVTAEAGGAQPLIANRDSVGDWERFDLVRLSATDVSLRSMANGRFVTAEAAGTQPLIANRSSVGQWETFARIPLAEGTTVLFSRADNRWVTAEAAGSQPLIANRTTIGQWEQFGLRGPDGGTLN